MSDVQDYWLDPDSHNGASFYVEDKSGKKDILLRIMSQYVSKDDSILEIGCNVGRNLNVLWEERYKKLNGIELNPEAVKEMKRFFPKLDAKIQVGAIEDLVKKLPNYDVIFSFAVFEHIPRESDWIFPELEKRANKFIITIEDEKNQTWRHFPRNYKKMFPNLAEIDETFLGSGGELDGFVARVLMV